MKKIIALLMLSLLVFTVSACGEEASSSREIVEQSYDDANDDWKPSILSKAGLGELEEPDGEKVFTEEENGNFKFTVTPFEVSSFNGMAQSIKSQAAHFSDDIVHSTLPDTEGKITEFTMSYTYNNKKVSIKMTINENALTAAFTFE